MRVAARLYRRLIQPPTPRTPSPLWEQPPCHVIDRLSKVSRNGFVLSPSPQCNISRSSSRLFFFPFATGHFSYECKATRPYVSRPSRTAQLENPRLFAESKRDAHPSVDVPEEFKNKFVFYFYLLLARLTEGVRSYG